MQSIKSKVMSLAHAIKEWFENFGQALRAAWKIIKLQAGYPVTLLFAKADGEVREAKAVAMSTTSTLEKGYFRFVEMVGDMTQWRSCRLERMI